MILICSNTEPGHPCETISGRAYVEEVDVDPVDGRLELRPGVQLRLGPPPVVVRAPVPKELLHLGQLRPLRPIGNRLPVGPARRRDALAQVDEILFRNVYAEGADFGMGRGGLGPAFFSSGHAIPFGLGFARSLQGERGESVVRSDARRGECM